MLPRCLGVGGGVPHTRSLANRHVEAVRGAPTHALLFGLLAAIAACPRGDKQQTKMRRLCEAHLAKLSQRLIPCRSLVTPESAL